MTNNHSLGRRLGLVACFLVGTGAGLGSASARDVEPRESRSREPAPRKAAPQKAPAPGTTPVTAPVPAAPATAAPGGTRTPRAAAAAPDTAVRLKSGAAYQGVLVENVPGDHVTIQLADGALRRFSAGEVASVLELGARAAPAAPAAVSPPLAKVEVELSSTHPDARLFQIAVLNDARPGAPMTATNTEICGPPCARELPPGTYKIVGPDLRPSPTFHLESSARHVNIAADPVTDGRRTGGAALLIGSGIAGTVGPYMLIYGGMISWFQSETMQESGPWKGIAVAGGVLTFAAVAMLIPGLVLFLKDSTVAVNKTAP